MKRPPSCIAYHLYWQVVHILPAYRFMTIGGRLVGYQYIRMKGNTQDNWRQRGAIAGGAAAVAGLTMGIIALSK